MTYDDRIIVYSEQPDSRGNFPNSILVFDYPETGYDGQQQHIDIHEMSIDREIILPNNFSIMRQCTPILHPDDYISLACTNSFPSDDPLRLDFLDSNHTIYGGGGSIFTWNENDSLVNFIPLNGTYYGNDKPKFNARQYPVEKTNNFTYISDTVIVSNSDYFELNGTSYFCPSSFSNGCTALYEFDRSGNVLNIIFGQQISNYNGYCSIQKYEVNMFNYLEIHPVNCNFRDQNDNFLFTVSYSWLILDSNLNHVMDFNNQQQCYSTNINGHIEVTDIEMTHDGLIYFSSTPQYCTGNGNWPPNVAKNYHGKNISGFYGAMGLISIGRLNSSSSYFLLQMI